MSLDLEENVIEVLWYCIEKTGVAEKTMRVVLDMSEGCETFVKCGEKKKKTTVHHYTTKATGGSSRWQQCNLKATEQPLKLLNLLLYVSKYILRNSVFL